MSLGLYGVHYLGTYKFVGWLCGHWLLIDSDSEGRANQGEKGKEKREQYRHLGACIFQPYLEYFLFQVFPFRPFLDPIIPLFTLPTIILNLESLPPSEVSLPGVLSCMVIH